MNTAGAVANCVKLFRTNHAKHRPKRVNVNQNDS